MAEDDASCEDDSGATSSGEASTWGVETGDTVCEDASADDVAVYAGSNGQYYSGWQVGRRLASDEWRLCVRDRVGDRRLVETTSGELLMLERTSIGALPAWTEVRSAESAVRIVDTRRALPPGRYDPSQRY